MVRGGVGSCSGVLRFVSCDPLFAEILHKKVEPAFHRLHPDLTLVFAEQNQEQTLEALSSSSADLGIFLSTKLTNSLPKCEVLTLTELVYCFAANQCPPRWTAGDPLPPDFTPRPQLFAEQGSTLRSEQNKICAACFSTVPAAACEAHLSLLPQLANLGIAGSRGQEPSRGHKFSILENFLSIRHFTSVMRLHFRSDLVGVALVGATPLHLLSQTTLPLKSPTRAFIAALRFANAVPPQTLLMVRI